MKNKYELIVIGGGFAGVAAAISAAKKGVDVLLVEKYNCLGGAASNALVMPFMRYWTKIPETDENKYLCGDVFIEIVDEMNKITNYKTPYAYHVDFDEEILKLVLNRLMQKYGVTLLFNTVITSVKTDKGNIISVSGMGKSAPLEFFADSFIDATGDAEICALSGAGYTLGRETDGLCQPMTLCFRMSGIDKRKYLKNKTKINTLYREFKQKGVINNPREDLLILHNYNDGVLHFNATRIVKRNPTNPFDVTLAEIEAREQVFEIHKFLKENIEGFENSRILSTAIQIGIRESRKIDGEYTLTANDLKSLARFDDAIATANYDIDIHNPEGEGTSHYFFKDGEWYEIPYRSLLPKGFNNLLVAGRCISATHEAQASIRIMPYCAELGQAAGTAASIAKKNGTDLRSVDIKEVQTVLRNEGFII